MIAFVEGSHVSGADGYQAVRASSGEAGEDREAERSTHHELGVDDPGCQTRLWVEGNRHDGRGDFRKICPWPGNGRSCGFHTQ